jgi:hypothetical protein
MQTKTRLDRQWMLINELSDTTEGKTIAELSQKFGESRSTLFDDLADLYSNGFPVDPICEKETCHWRLRKFAAPTELTLKFAELLMVYFIMRLTPMHGGDQGFRGIYYGAYNKIEALLEKIHGIGYAQHCISHGQSLVEPNGPYKDIISIIATNTYECGELDYYNSNDLNTAAMLSHLDDDSTYHKGENTNDSENDVSDFECPF